MLELQFLILMIIQCNKISLKAYFSNILTLIHKYIITHFENTTDYMSM